MINYGKYKILSNYILCCDYDYLLIKSIRANKNKENLIIFPVASHPLVIALFNENLNVAFNEALLVPDSQWVKRSMFFLYGIRLKDRVYGPELTLKMCRLAEKMGYKVFFYGTNSKVLFNLKKRVLIKYPLLKIDTMPSMYDNYLDKELNILYSKIVKLKVDIIFIGLGSPRQEIYSIKLINKLKLHKKNVIIVTVGAAFDFLSGSKDQAPQLIQDFGFEWLFRLLKEPKRLWKRYLIYGPIFIVYVFFDFVKLRLNSKK